jgi:tetraacyldisaccharide 4'-kinase
MYARAVLALERALEEGSSCGWRGSVARAVAAAWAPVARRSVVRSFSRPARDGARLIAIGGATLGGSGKTPLAVASAAYLASLGARVVLVGHAYRARPGGARVVAVDDPVEEVGDEALLAARALAVSGASVLVAPKRARALEIASRLADVIVIDGVLQTAPTRASLALLAVDAVEPWGRAPFLPPAGHLRAPQDALLAACDMVVSVGDSASADVRFVAPGVFVSGVMHTWADVRDRQRRGARLGLLAALARPDRVIRFLARRGVCLQEVVRAPDHGPFGPRALALAARARVDMWLATPKCALHLGRLTAPLAILDGSLELAEGLRSVLALLVNAGRRALP